MEMKHQKTEKKKVIKKLFETIATWAAIKFGKEKEMIPPFVMTMAADFLKDLVMDKLQDLKPEHIDDKLNKAPKELREAFDKAIDEDSSHGHKSLMDFLK